MEFKDLTPSQQEKVRTCETPKDLMALAKEEGYELTDDELAGISGGWDCQRFKPFAPNGY